MGTVWHARHPDGVDVAVKVLRPEYADKAEVLEAFRREVRAVAALDHPGVVRVFDYGVVPESLSTPDDPIVAGTPWLSMEYAPEGTLGDRAGATSWHELRETLAQVLDGLAHSHARDIVHRDLKPRNVLVMGSEPGRPQRVVLTDYGIAHALSQRSAHRAQAGTPGYMAPEQIQGEWRDLGPWTDLYSLGALAWRLATGRSAFAGDRPATVLYAQLHGKLGPFEPTCEVPAGLQAWIRRLLEVRPAARYPSAADAVAGLRALDRRDAAAPVPLDWRPGYPPTTVAPNGTGLALFVLRPWPLVGREDIQDQLWVALNRVATTRKAAAVVLSGARGVGKTRLAAWLAERAAETGAAWVLRAPSARGAGAAMVRAARAFLRIDDLPADESRQRLARWFSDRGSASAEADADAVYELLAGDSPRVGRLDPWSLLIDRLAHERPLIVAVDDLHREREAVEWLGRVIGTERAVLVVATMERSASPPFRDKIDELRPSVRWIEVPALTREQQRALVDAGVGLEPRLAEQVVERTAGDPALAVKVVADWAKRGILVPTSHGFGLKDRSDARVEEPLVEELDARMAGLGERVVRTLEALAVLGGSRVARGEWQAVCASAGAPLSSGDVDVLRAAGHLVTTQEGGTSRVSLEPPPIRDLLLHRARAGGRAVGYHEAAAAVLVALPKASARERAVIHFVDAGSPNRALTHLRALIDESERQGQARRLP
ncbi:MAG: protein kinase, partial [Myxococcota bacterium]